MGRDYETERIEPMNLERFTVAQSARVIGIVALCILGLVLANVVYDRHQERQKRLKKLDEKSLVAKIAKVEKKTKALKKAAQLHPVWENWQLAQDVANEFDVKLSPSPEHRGRNRNTWVGSMNGSPLLILATAKRIQEKVASQILTIDYMGSRARLEMAVYGTDDS